MNLIKKYILSFMLLLAAVSIKAADKFTVEPCYFLPGDTCEVSLALSNTTEYRAFQADVVLPDGLSFVTNSDGKAVVSLTDRASSTFVINSSFKTKNALRLVCYSNNNDVFKGSDGTLVKIKVKASDTFVGGSIKVGNTIFTTTQNQDMPLSSSSVAVEKKSTLTVTVNNSSRRYGDDNPKFSFSYAGFKDGETESSLQKVPTVTTSATKTSSIGQYSLSASGGQSNRYIFKYVSGTLTVTKAPLTISAGNYTKKQGDPMPEFKASYDGFKNGETEDVLTKKPVITTTATESSAPGSYPVTVSAAEAQNYNISYQPGTLTVTEADAVIITAKSYSRVYGDNNPTFEYEVQGAQLDGVPEITCEATKNSPVGTYTIVVKQGSVKNYNVTFANGTLTVTKASLTVSAGNYTKKQGDAMPTFKASYEGFKNSENEDVLTKKPVITTTATESSAPGSYPVTVSGAEAQNYDISYQPGTLTVTEADAVIITVKSYSRVYGDNNPTFEYEVQGAQLDGVPEITCEAVKNSPVGTYAIVVKQGTVKNYNVSFANGTLTVTKAPLTVSAGNYTKKQGDPMPEFKAIYQGFKNNETEDVLSKKPVITTTATESSAPGSYPVTVSGAEAQNYDISYQPGTLTVTEADAVIITVKSYSRVYGDNNPTFEYEVQGAQLDGVPEITCEAVKNSPVGTYAIVVKQGTVKNYNVSFANGTLTVTKAPLTISAGNYTKKQDDPIPEFKASYEGFKNNETEDVLTKKPVITTTATETSAPGSYPVTVSGAEAQNYDISYQSGTLTVIEADAVIITAKSYSRVYGDNNPTFEYEIQGAQLDGVPEITCEATKDSPVGTYAIVVKQGSVKNYNVTFANGTLTVTKALLTVSAGNYTKKQGDPMPEFKASYEGFKNDENEGVLTTKPSFSTDANENSEPGEYEVKVSGAEAQNYDFNYVNGKLIIINKEKKHQTITWNQDIQATAGQTVEMTATASSGLPVTYTFYLAGGGGGWPWSDIDGNRITFKEAGARIIIAHQEGNDDYEAAEPDTMYFNVLSADEADGLMYIDGLYYKYNDDSQSALKVVRGYKSYMGNIVVPLTANGLPVVSLGDFAFYTSDKLNTVVIGDNVKEYGGEALSNSYNIRSITFPRNCTDLPAWLCNGSRGIKEIHCRSVKPYPGSSAVFNLDDDFYQNCTLYVPKGTIDAYRASELWGRFANIVEEDVVLSKVDAPVISTDNDILNISCDTYGATIYYTLDGTEPSEDSRIYTEPVSLSASCYIKTFAKKEGLANSDVVSGEYHNSQYPDIIKVGDVFTANIINNGVDSLLMYFKVLSVYPFEAELEAKANYVQGWTNKYNIFGDLEVPAEVSYAGIQFKVGSIGDSSLSFCTHTNHLKLNEGLETIEGSAFRYINNIKELVIPNSVKRIEGAFVTECYSLKTITLGTGLLSFGVDAFWTIPALQNIYSLNPVPPTFDDPNRSFEEMPIDQITLYVPIGSKSAYENAPGWNLFAGRIVEIDPTGIAGVTADGLSITVSNHHIHVEGAKAGSILNVYDLSGNKCMSVRITSDKVDINCNVPNGVYVVRLGNVSKKVVL